MRKNLILMKPLPLLALWAALALASAPAAASEPRQAYIDKTFVAMDANGDGHVDKAEYARFQQARFDQQSRAVDLAFNELDQDKDGKISKAESAVVPEIERYFEGLDTDRDGFLSREEMQRAMVAAQTAEAAIK